jgi:hypothetical protein
VFNKHAMQYWREDPVEADEDSSTMSMNSQFKPNEVCPPSRICMRGRENRVEAGEGLQLSNKKLLAEGGGRDLVLASASQPQVASKQFLTGPM